MTEKKLDITQSSKEKTEDLILKEAISNVDLIDLQVKNMSSEDLFAADIDFMNNYLNSLPDYSKMTSNSQQTNTKTSSYNTSNVRLRDHTNNPKSTSTTSNANEYKTSRNNTNSHKGSAPQSVVNQRREINPLSKSYSIHTLRNMNQSIEKEVIDDQPQQQKNKISRSTSSSTIPAIAKDSQSTSDLMGFVRKPSSLINIFKKLGSQNPPQSSLNQNTAKTTVNNNSSSSSNCINNNSNNNNNNVRKNSDGGNSKNSSKTKSISDFWKDNVQSTSSNNNKVGWNYHKIMSNLNQKSSNSSSSHEPSQPQSNPPQNSVQIQPLRLHQQAQLSTVEMKRVDPIEPIKPVIQNFVKILQNETQNHPSSNQLNQSVGSNYYQQHRNTNNSFPHQHQQPQHCHLQTHSHFGKSQSIHGFVKTMTDSPKLQRSPRVPLLPSNNELDHEQHQKLLKSSSNSHIYLNKDDPNYLKNLHKITKSLDNATNNFNQSKYKRSISNSNVPNFMAGSPQQSQFYYPAQAINHQTGAMMLVHPSSAPISFYPPMTSSFKPTQEYHMQQPQRSGSRSNIPVYYKCNPLNRSASNTSMMTNYNGSQAMTAAAASMGYYNMPDPLLCWKQQQPTAPVMPMHVVNKSSSSSCIYSKAINQPTHLGKNNDIFAKYKPIVSDDEESESDEEDVSKHSNKSASKGSSYISISKIPAPFGKQHHHHDTPKYKNSSLNQYPTPFTKINSIPIPINGQLPSAFKNSNESISKLSTNNISSESSRKNSLICGSSHKTPSMTNAQTMKNSCNQSNESSSNIFFNFLNPMAATQPQMHFQQQENSKNSVGCTYTPYTQYLSDRKYFDVASMSGVNTTTNNSNNNNKTEQMHNSTKIPTLSATTANTTTVEPKKNNISAAVTQLMTAPSVDDAMRVCDDAERDEKSKEKNVTNTVENVANVGSTNATTCKENIFTVDPKEILSAFDPFFIDDSSISTPSTSSNTNKLHQLLSAVTNEWNNNDCDLAVPPPSATTSSTSSSTSKFLMNNNCKNFHQTATTRFGSCQYEVDEHLKFVLNFFCC